MRAFIIGNGISLHKEQLEKIGGNPSFACNRINLIYEATAWRPTHYTHVESLAPDLPYIEQNINLGIECFLSEHYAAPPVGVLGLPDAPNVHWVKHCHHHLLNFDSPEVPDEWHGICTFGGSVNFMMQIAVQQGYDELVLLGCDLEYRDNKPSHFSDRYEHGGEQPAFYASRNALFGHIQALNWIRRKKKNITVLNATDGGLLELWQRVRLEDVV